MKKPENQPNTQEKKENPDVQGIQVNETKPETKDSSQQKESQPSKEDIVRDYESTLKRLQADFENYIKRTEKEKQDFAKYSSAKIIAKFLILLDDLDRAMLLLESKNQDPEIKTGIQMIHKQFHKILEAEGVKPMNCKNKKFDPYCHEIIDMIEHESDEGTVVEELQKGYHIHEKVLRTAKVRVSKGKSKKEGAK